MNALWPYFHSFTLCLVTPRAALDWLRLGIPPEGARAQFLPVPDLVSQLSISWVFALVQGIARLLLAHLLVQLFLNFHNGNDFFYALIQVEDALFPYYLMFFTTALDLIFFPILTLVLAEFWGVVLRAYARWLQVEGDRNEICREITTVAMSSHFFLLLPIIGVVFQQISWLYLLYVGIRHHLKATRTLAILILLTPSVVMLMAISLVALMVFCLFV